MRFPSALKAVVFDLDGTLLDTAPEFVEVAQRLREENGLAPMDEARIRETVSDGARAMVSLALDMSTQHEDFERQRQRFLEIYARDIGRATRPYPGIEALLTQLAEAGIRWGISTNKPSYLTEALLDKIDLRPAAATIVCPDHVRHPKPHPEPLLLNSKQLGCMPQSVIYIGDHKRDIDAGNAAGMFTIAAAYGYIHAHDDAAQWGAAAVASSSQELDALVRAAAL